MPPDKVPTLKDLEDRDSLVDRVMEDLNGDLKPQEHRRFEFIVKNLLRLDARVDETNDGIKRIEDKLSKPFSTVDRKTKSAVIAVGGSAAGGSIYGIKELLVALVGGG